MEKIKLVELIEGDKATVIALSGGGRFIRHIAGIGIRPGCRLEIISKSGSGKMVLNTSFGRIAIGHGMAEKIIVSK